jgi:acyl-CoA-binding protein
MSSDIPKHADCQQSRASSDLGSTDDVSYNSWKNGRETSNQSTGASTGTPSTGVPSETSMNLVSCSVSTQKVSHVRSGIAKPMGALAAIGEVNPWEQGTQVDVKWRTEADLESAAETVSEAAPVSEVAIMDEVGKEHNYRRVKVLALVSVLCLALLAIVLPIYFVKGRDEHDTHNSVIGIQDNVGGTGGGGSGAGATVITGTKNNSTNGSQSSPVGENYPQALLDNSTAVAVSLIDYEATVTTLCQVKVKDALSSCTNVGLLRDITTDSGMVYELLWQEVKAAAFEQAENDVEAYVLKYSNVKLLEKYALLMFYKRIGGEDWTKNTGWDTASDVCTWHGVECNANNCAEKLTLSKCISAYWSTIAAESRVILHCLASLLLL